MSEDVVRVLREARAFIENGWCQGTLVNTYGERCAKGAIYGAIDKLAVQDERGRWDLSYSAQNIFAKAVGVSRTNITNWNDAPERNKSQVLTAFDRAIALASQEERP